jgi:cytochrome c-type biogenesis protein
MDWQKLIYWSEQWAGAVVTASLTDHLSVASVVIAWVAGVVTSLSPCTLSMLPITIAYIGGSRAKEPHNLWQQSLWFAVGLSLTLTVLGLGAASLGTVYGQWGRQWLNLGVGMVAIVMGLQLLEVWSLPMVGLDSSWVDRLPAGWRSVGIGCTFGLAASPCSTPVLFTLLAWSASTGKLADGALLLFSYGFGSTLPLLLAGGFTGMVKNLLALRQWTQWLSWGSGVLLIGFGVFRVLPALQQLVNLV